MKSFIHCFFAFALLAASLLLPQLVNAHDVVAKDAVGAAAAVAMPNVDDEEEKLTIAKIMQLAHKSGLLKQVATGKATPEEKLQLLDYYRAMPALSPPRGDAESWTEKTAALIESAKAAVDGEADAGGKLKAATNCAACHSLHK